MTAIGFIALARPTFDVALANQLREQGWLTLTNAGFQLVGPDELVMTIEGVEHTLRLMSIVRPEVLVVMQASFTDASLLLNLVEMARLPVLLWAVPEAPSGGRLRLNSFGGLNLAAHSLKRLGAYYEVVYALPTASTVVEKVRTMSKVAAVCRQLYGTRVGRIGDNAAGYTNALVNYEALQIHLGISIEQIELGEVFHEARAADPKLVGLLTEQMQRDLVGLEGVDQRAVFGTLSLYAALRKLVDRYAVAGLAVRTAPEVFTELACTADGALALLNNEFIPCNADVDVNNVITQLVLQWISDKPATSVEMVQFDHQQGAILLWHAGHAPLSMADPLMQPRASVHPQRQLPLLMEFALKPGRVTLARLSETTGSFRLVISTGEMLQMPMETIGTVGMLRPDSGCEAVMNTVLSEGIEPQFALTYGDHAERLLTMASMLGLATLRL
ncbi:MAG: hypothetical protein KF716_19590 [Anaerolineae bacterium]|nr:hypothetical protein [Anaerolineae bacterium]